MLIWFFVLAPVLVAEVFRSPMMDLRFVVLGALLPLLDVFLPLPPYLHTLLAPLLALLAVMLLTMNRRLLRRRWLGIPIGLFMHIFLDATWRFDELFLWPAFGSSLAAIDPPELGISVPVSVFLELAAICVGALAYKRYDLDKAPNRHRLWRKGQLDRSVFG